MAMMYSNSKCEWTFLWNTHATSIQTAGSVNWGWVHYGIHCAGHPRCM